MAISYKTFSNDLKAKDLNYSDEYFVLKSERVIPSDSFSFNSYEAFKNINDFKTNNFSNLFLINKQRNSQWLGCNVKKEDQLNGVATTISWYAGDNSNPMELGSWLYFGKNYEMFDFNVSKIDAMLTYSKPEKNYSNYIFYLEYLSETLCRISHTFGDLKFYLSVGEDKTVKFVKNPQDDSEKFIYSIDGKIIKLHKKVLHRKYNDVGDVTKTYYGFYTLGVERTETNSVGKLKLYDDDQVSDNQFAYINDVSLDYDFYTDASWVGYDRKENISSIKHDKSAFNLETQAIIHHQYNKDDGFNFIPLKNNLSYRGNTIRGNNLTTSSDKYPDVDFRVYNTLSTGFNQEKGSDTITLTFTFNDQEYEVNDGDDLHFSIAKKNYEDSNYLEPLFPYKYININDTKFVKNGAFGSNVPYFSDKVKKQQGAKSVVYDLNGVRSTPNNGVYLCTWLYKKDNESQPIWLDRYYYPDVIERAKALKGISNFEQSFDNILDKNYMSDQYLKNKIFKRTYVDKVSDVIIEPGNNYIYQRISSKMVKEILDNIEPNRILTATDQKNKTHNLYDGFLFDGENYRRISYKDWNNTNAINFNTDIYLSKNKRMGIQLFGCDYTSGFNIQNRKDLVPYHYYSTEECVYLLNNNFQIVHKFDLTKTYGDKIVKVILGDVFDDVIVVSGVWLYILGYDLRLKSKISLTASSDDELDIKGLGVIKEFVGNKMTKLLNYPYADSSIRISVKTKNNGTIKKERPQLEEGIKIERPRLIKHKKVQRRIDSGSVHYPSNLSLLLAQSNSLFYKNNIYVPMNNKILKIIFCPDVDKDFEIFGVKDRDSYYESNSNSTGRVYPAAARLLTADEYILNFQSGESLGKDSESLSTESGFIMVENKIKNIFIDEDGKLFATNFDKMAISPDGDTIYGLYGQDVYLATGQWFWLFNQSMAKMQADVSTSKYAEFASPNSIDAIRFNERGEMCLLRNFHNLSDNENEDNNKRLDIYDKTKKRIYTYDLSSYEEIISLDSYNYINDAGIEETCFTALLKGYTMVYRVTYFSNEKKIVSQRLEVPKETLKTFHETVNSNVLLRYKDYNSLYFNLYVPSDYYYDHQMSIKWNLKDIQEGWYNLNVLIDLDAAIFQVRVNDNVIGEITNETCSWFLPHVSSNGSVFSNSYTLGTIGKKYGTTLNNILINSIYDPYVCRNSKIANLQLYNKRLDFYEYQAMRLRDKKINPIILTLPCGNRNGIDEIVRYFKYNSAGAISNKVKINVSGTGLQTEGEFEMMRKEIMSVLEKNVDCLVEVKEIEFI